MRVEVLARTRKASRVCTPKSFEPTSPFVAICGCLLCRGRRYSLIFYSSSLGLKLVGARRDMRVRAKNSHLPERWFCIAAARCRANREGIERAVDIDIPTCEGRDVPTFRAWCSWNEQTPPQQSVAVGSLQNTCILYYTTPVQKPIKLTAGRRCRVGIGRCGRPIRRDPWRGCWCPGCRRLR